MMSPIWQKKDAKRLNTEFLSRHEHDLPFVIQGARMLALVDPPQAPAAVKLITCLDDSLKNRTLTVRNEHLT